MIFHQTSHTSDLDACLHHDQGGQDVKSDVEVEDTTSVPCLWGSAEAPEHFGFRELRLIPISARDNVGGKWVL